jgi:peptidyl-prolyl cis-trans isomerase B (cyclophilin B)
MPESLPPNPNPAQMIPGEASSKVNPSKRKNMIKLETNLGDITIELDSEKAPLTTRNFLEYVNSGYYDNTLFHRVIDGFMIQGGGFEPGMKQKQARAPIQNEAANGLKNEKYTIAMARTSDVHSAAAQFFINVADNASLNYTSSTPRGFGYCVFGRVVDGKDIVDKIKKVKTGSRSGHQDVPLEDVIVLKASVAP